LLVAGNLTVPEPLQLSKVVPVADSGVRAWTSRYVRKVAAADAGCGLAAGLLAFEARFGNSGPWDIAYLWLALALPLLWLAALALSGAYDTRFIGVGSDEFRRVLNAGVSLTAAVAVVAYATKTELARGYVLVALPSLTCLDLIVRYRLRKGLHRLRARGSCMRRVVVAGHSDVISDLISELRRETHHGLTVVAACVAGRALPESIDGIPVAGSLADVADVVCGFGADTVAVLSCPEMIGTQLRALAWDLEKTGTDLCVAPALIDVAGPRTTIRPVAGLPLLHVDHPEFTGLRRLIKAAFDRTVATLTLLLLGPILIAAGLVIRMQDGGPALFRQVRVGKDGKRFTVYKLRTMVVDADKLKADLLARNEASGVLFKMRNDPRVTAAGYWLRRWSIDELPQLINVVRGNMSLVGPRPLLPDEAERYGDGVQRRLAVKPGITGLWQVSGRSDLSWGDTVRLELRYIENWSLMLDLQVLWKTWSAVLHHDGAYLSPPLMTPDDQPRKDRHAQPARRAASSCRLVRLGRRAQPLAPVAAASRSFSRDRLDVGDRPGRYGRDVAAGTGAAALAAHCQP
jgi:exopolysaccharide biosynthesis polyprenyl glycosylphosphotransferase